MNIRLFKIKTSQLLPGLHFFNAVGSSVFGTASHTKGEDTKGHEETRRDTKGLCGAA
jgi:hypothetical protein